MNHKQKLVPIKQIIKHFCEMRKNLNEKNVFFLPFVSVQLHKDDVIKISLVVLMKEIKLESQTFLLSN